MKKINAKYFDYCSHQWPGKDDNDVFPYHTRKPDYIQRYIKSQLINIYKSVFPSLKAMRRVLNEEAQKYVAARVQK